MFKTSKAFIKRHWPVLRLRTIIFGTLLFVAALPGASAVFLRIYENALVRQTEAELIAQGAVIVAVAHNQWRDTAKATFGPAILQAGRQSGYDREPTTIDLNATPILTARPHATLPTIPADREALRVARNLTPALLETSRTTLASIQMLDRHGNIVAGYEIGRSQGALTETRRAMLGRPITLLRRNRDYHPRYSFEWLSRASGLRLHHARPIIKNGRVVGVLLLTRSPRVLFQGIYEDLGKILFGMSAILIILILLTAFVARAIVRPVESLSAAVRAVAAGNGYIPERPGLGVVEIRDLYDDFQTMAETIARRSAYLRDFAASVSHEFKTPLSGMRGGIELLADHSDTMTREERDRFLGNMTIDVNRLSHLVKRLMELAQADMSAIDDHAHTSVKEAINPIVDAFRRDDFAITLVFPSDLPLARATKATIEAVAATIIENSTQAGATQMAISIKAENDLIMVDFEDNGPGVPMGDRKRIFDPFFTSKRSDGGTGLGLAIAQSLVHANKGKIELLPTRSGATFSLVLCKAAPV